ncbi:hypothetical protein DESC_830024 [Desulfosarcina cetonica]|nr:hypothetical protein DESC_830024 [Desulfosarcina cetonica]
MHHQIELVVAAGDDGVAQSHDPLGVKDHVVVHDEDPANLFPVIDVVQVGQYALDGIGAKGSPVHVFHAAEGAGAGATAGGLDQLDFGIENVVSPGEPPLIPDGQFEGGKVQRAAPGIMHESAVDLVREGGDLLQAVLAAKGVDQAPASLLAFAADEEVDQGRFGRGGDLLAHQRGVVAADDDFYFRQDSLDQARQLQAGVILPGHGREAHQLRPDAGQGAGQIATDVAAFADQVDQVDVVLRVDIAAHAGDAVTGHVDRHFVDDDGDDIRHGDQDHFHDEILPG